MHEWHIKNGALFEDVGQLKRAWYYQKKNFSSAVNREVKATRDLVILDINPRQNRYSRKRCK